MSISVLSPPASSEADLGLCRTRASRDRIQNSGGIETMKSKLFRIALVCASMLALLGTAAAQGRDGLTGESTESCAPIAAKSEQTAETSAATVAIFAKMPATAEATSANFVRTSARKRRRPS